HSSTSWNWSTRKQFGGSQAGPETLNFCRDALRRREPLCCGWTKEFEKDILSLLNFLPEGCRAIFNLFAIEGYPHKEIARMLSISEGTSKSQLNFARKKLQELLINQNI
ncbi:MAG: sigma-70 family RNA polymerase sigma factor, partial [Chryseobacterium sp.]